MKSIISAEIKRVLKSRPIIIMCSVALLATIALALLLVNSLEYTKIDKNDNIITYSGFSAAKEIRNGENSFVGYLEPDVLREIYADYLELYEQYGNEIPDEINLKELQPTWRILYLVRNVYDDSSVDGYVQPSELTPEQAAAFYEQRIIHQEREYFAFINDNPSALSQARALEAQVQKPFYYVSNTGWLNAGEFLTSAIYLIAILCSFMVASTFSSEYQTGSDDVFRCTRNGRTKLAVSKAVVAIGLSMALYIVCIGIYCGFVTAILGSAGLDGPLQIFRVDTPVPLTLGQLFAVTILCSGLSLLAVVCFSLFISARMKTPFISVVVCIIMLISPIFANMGKDIAIIDWIKYLIPSCGVGLENNVFYEMLSYMHFVKAGPISIWAPYVMVVASVIGILLFFLLAIRAYNRHEVK